MTRAFGNPHDYLPAAGRDALLPGYDLLTRLLGVPKDHAALIAQAELASGQSVLEIGCGTGSLAISTKRAQPGAEVIGSDPDPLALARAERRARDHGDIRFERGYAQDLPYPDGSFDRVLSSLMLHHLAPDVQARAATEVLRVLRPGGTFHIADVAATPDPDPGLMERLMRHSPDQQVHAEGGILSILRTAGFDAAEVGFRRSRLIGRITYFRAVRRA